MLAGSGSAAVFTCSATSRGSTCLVDRMGRPRPSWNVIACAAEQSASHPTSAAPATSPLIRRRRLTNEVFPGAGAVRPGYRCVTMLRKALTAAEAALTPVGLVADEIPAQQRTLGEQDQRPWPLPERPWLMGQTWYDLLFAHWAVPTSALRRLVPEPLEVHLYEGRGWLGITPFVIGGLRLRGTPPLPWLSAFPELNVRT